MTLAHLPGGVMVEQGLRDLAVRLPTPEAWVVSIAPTALRHVGLQVPAPLSDEAELGLFEVLQNEGDPYGRYNAMKRELDSFLAAARQLGVD